MKIRRPAWVGTVLETYISTIYRNSFTSFLLYTIRRRECLTRLLFREKPPYLIGAGAFVFTFLTLYRRGSLLVANRPAGWYAGSSGRPSAHGGGFGERAGSSDVTHPMPRRVCTRQCCGQTCDSRQRCAAVEHVSVAMAGCPFSRKHRSGRQ